MPRFFTLNEAEALLPAVREEIRKAIHLKRENEKAEEEMNAFLHKLNVAGGMIPDRQSFLGHRARRDATAMRLNEIITEIHEMGVQVKDLDVGLIDFPTLLRGEEVLLCWKLGEGSIEYWHGTSEGFRGRKKIDRDFIDNHRGDSAK
jgi:hypothetical protein